MPQRRRVLVTAGGTREPIDDVRFVANVASGALPAALANRLLELGHDVLYLHGPQAILPGRMPLDPDLTRLGARELAATVAAWLALAEPLRQAVARGSLTLQPVTSAAEAAAQLAHHVAVWQPDAVACAMAVADFSPQRQPGKLSSQTAELTLRMTATPKTIDLVKAIRPDVRLLGFKLLSGASEAEFQQAARRLCAHAHADRVFCNDMADVARGLRRGLLLAADGRIVARLEGGRGAEGLEALAAGLVAAWLACD